MILKRLRWMAAFGLALSAPGLAAAQEGVWRAVARTPAPPAVVASSAPVRTAPIATLGKPVALAAPPSDSVAPPCEPLASSAPLARGGSITPVEYRQTAPVDQLRPLVRAQAPDPDPPASALAPRTGEFQPGVASPSVKGPYGVTSESAKSSDEFMPTAGSGVGTAPAQPVTPDDFTTHTASGPSDPPPPLPPAAAPPDVVPGVLTDRPVAPTFWEKCKGWMEWGDKGSANGRTAFQSDNSFPGLISPVTNPFFFEDPRSLTELRPIFMYQSVPGKAPYPGGDAYFFGTQARIAFTERFSVVMNELGFVSLDPSHADAPYPNSTGFAEIKIGPKYTFLRDCASGTVAAAGLTFEIPMGDKKVYQDTGTLGLDPYVTIGKTFGRLPNGFGSINLMGELGYSFATDDRRAEFLHTSLHLDYNIANLNKFYPLIEFNWLHYTNRPTNSMLGFEGGDLVNFGSSTRQGRDFITTALGARYRFTDNIFAGAAVEIPLSHERGLEDYRLTFDVIFRY